MSVRNIKQPVTKLDEYNRLRVVRKSSEKAMEEIKQEFQAELEPAGKYRIMQSTTTRLFVGNRIGLQFLESSLLIRDSSLITASEDNGNYGVSPVY